MAERKTGKAGSGSNGTESNSSDPIDPAATIRGNSSGDSGGSDRSIERDAAGNIFDPSIHVAPDKRNTDGSFRRKRGRGASKNRSNRSQKVSTNLDELVQILSGGMVMFHGAIAAATKTPEMVISPEEAESISKSALTFLEQFDVEPNPKVTAGLIFMGNVIAVYGTRYAAIRIRHAQEREEKKKGTAGVYTPDGFAAGTTDFKINPDQPTAFQ